MNITLTSADIAATVKRSLSIIGKRARDDNGNLLFQDISIGSREEAILDDFFSQAVIELATETAAFITDSTESSITLTFPENHNTKLDTFIQKSCVNYCVSYALYSWFTITAPQLSKKYQEDCNSNVASIIRLINDKKAPEGTLDILSTSTSIT